MAQALPGALRWLAEIEPLRQILAGTRVILYFEARADAGLTRAVRAAALGLVFRLAITPPSTNLATGFSQTGRPHGREHPYNQERAWGNRIPAFLSVERYTHIATGSYAR
jgi:hypothetical protein